MLRRFSMKRCRFLGSVKKFPLLITVQYRRIFIVFFACVTMILSTNFLYSAFFDYAALTSDLDDVVADFLSRSEQKVIFRLSLASHQTTSFSESDERYAAQSDGESMEETRRAGSEQFRTADKMKTEAVSKQLNNLPSHPRGGRASTSFVEQTGVGLNAGRNKNRQTLGVESFQVPMTSEVKGHIIKRSKRSINGHRKFMLHRCPDQPSKLRRNSSEITVMMRPSELASKFGKLLEYGGHYRPSSCEPVEKTAILIPYRHRWEHLHTLLSVLIPMLCRQNVDFTIYVIEQMSRVDFNKGLLFNAGFLEALKVDNYDCFILHDVDMIPLDDRNMYRCNKTGPIHLSAGVNKFKYGSLYPGLFGGVVSFTRDQFEDINGASNMYFGWGAEDDDLRDRAINRNYTLMRKSAEYGMYDMIQHRSQPGWYKNSERFRVFGPRLLRQHIDGLNSVIYKVHAHAEFPIYTWIGVGFDKDQMLATVPENLRMWKEDDHGWSREDFHIVDLP